MSFEFYIKLILQVENCCVSEIYILFDNIQFYEVVMSRRKGKCHRAVWTLIQSHTICHFFQAQDGFKGPY